MKNIPATKPSFSQSDIQFITKEFKQILNGKSFLSQGKFCEIFETRFSEFIGTKYAVTCNSGTSALELIFRALDVKNKEVILPSNTFIATANAILNAGGIPVFADCNEDMCLDFEKTTNLVNKNTAAICHVHIGGLVSPSAPKLSKFCKKNKIFFVEDAAQAHGSSINKIMAGNLGDAAGFSFFSTKVMTTGEGGIVTTNNKKLVAKMRSIREFGKEKKGIYTNYHTSLGYNWRMPEVSALMGISQLESIGSFIEKRTKIAKIYDSYFLNLNIARVIQPHQSSNFNYFKYILVIKKGNRRKIHEALTKEGINLSGYVYEIPLHKQPVFKNFNSLSLPETENLCAQHICLPIYPDLSVKDANLIAKSLLKIFDKLLET
jgi:perosamine synthetase